MSASSSEKQLSIPRDVYRAMKVPEDKRDETLQRELALSLYREQILSFGKARQLANMTKWQFHELLKERNIERHYTEENLKEDLEYTKEFPRLFDDEDWEKFKKLAQQEGSSADIELKKFIKKYNEEKGYRRRFNKLFEEHKGVLDALAE
ncbi:UPF0175 family protein [Halarsenatibacter silvermanii]|uniref:Predicted antitoxin, contains HTH domain n=1 Tax=Halarsenatibacter silvermanii TaxID=321763 RepID=A0A1G9U904_9FIRM|nr:UPF0175 family protein [Halarsenatibacter silvermanii]SDM56194.1 Predicted antitoxin, contains HTH domain [Halarsenatibacter silvermanii]